MAPTNPFDQFDTANPFDIFDEGYAGPVHRPDEPSIGQELGAKLKSGAIRGKSFIDERLSAGLFGDEDESEKAVRIADAERRAQMADRTSASTQRGLQEISGADTFGEAVKAVLSNPRAVGMTTAQSLGMVAPVMAAGAASGPAAPAVIGMGSGAIEYEASMRETLEEHGVDLTDVTDVRRALQDPVLIGRARKRAVRRGVAIGAFDALTAGVAGRLVAGSRGVISAASRAGGETGVQLGGGMAGEATAQAITGEHRPGDIVMEGIAEVPTAITEVPTNYRRSREAGQRRQADRQLVQDDYRSLADEFDATITSLDRSKKKNEEVGGVANSQHLKGTAGDFVVPADRKRAFIEAAKRRGYEAIDEGDHVHLEMPSGKAGRAMIETRRQQRMQAVMDGLKSPGVAAAEGALDTARDRSGIDLGDDLVPDKPKRSKSPDTGKPMKPVNVDDLIGKPAEAPRRPADSIDALAEQMLDQVAAQSLPPSPAVDSTPQLVQPADMPAPPVADIDATLPDQPSLPTQLESTNDLPPGIATPAAQAPAAPSPEPMATQPAPVAAQEPPAPPAATPVPPATPEPPVAPPAQPQDTRDQWEWEPVGQFDVPESEKAAFAGFLNRNGLAQSMGVEQVAPEQVMFVALREDQQARIDQLGEVLGRKIVLYDVDVPRAGALGGFAFDDKHILVNVRASRLAGNPVVGLIGHEFTHTLRRQGSPLLEELIAYARTQINTDSAYVQQMYRLYRDRLVAKHGMEGFSDTFTEELVADFIGDLLNDDQFWAELAAQDQPLFKRLINSLIRWLTKMADKARRLGADDAFHDIEGMRQQAIAIMREHLRDPNRPSDPTISRRGGRDVAAHFAPFELDPAVEAEWSYRQGLREQAATDRARAFFEKGNYMDAAREVMPFVKDSPEWVPTDTPEMVEFVKKSSRKVNPNIDKARVYTHGTARDVTRFEPKAGQAVFLAGRASFSGPFSAASMTWMEDNAAMTTDVTVDGQSMQDIKKREPVGSVDWMYADLILRHGTDVHGAIEHAREDYVYTIEGDMDVYAPEAWDIDPLIEKLEAAKSAKIKRTVPPEKGAMRTMPLVTSAENPFDPADVAHRKRLVKELKESYRTAPELSAAMREDHSAATHHNLKQWDDVESILKNDSNWPFMENRVIVDLLQEMGFDAYFVTEEGHRNLAVFDPKKVKSAYGNVGPWGMRKPTAEEAAQLGMTLEEAFAAQEAGDIRLRLGNVLHSTFSNGLYRDDTRAQLERWFLDEFRDLRDIQKMIAQQHFGGTLPDSLNAHRAENLRHGAYQDARTRAEEKFIRPIAQVISKVGGDIDGFSDYLWWRHAQERRDYLLSKMDPAMAAQMPPEYGAGIDPAQAQRNIAALDPQVRRAYERAAKFIDGMRRFTLDTLLASGQITREHHDNLLQQYEFYVPLRGIADDSDVLNGRGQKAGLGMNKNPIGPRATGRTSKPLNIIEEMMRDMDLALIGQQKQAVLDSLVKLIVAHPDPDLWEVQPVKAERKWVNGVLTVVQTNGEPKDQITFMHHGIPVRIEIRHPELKKAVLNMNEPLPGWLRRVGRVTRWLSAVKTSLSPFFLLINPVRDAGLASMAVLAEHDMATLEAMAEMYPLAMGALRRDAKNIKVAPTGNAKRDRMQQYARELSSLGGKTGYTYVADIREQQRKLDALIARHSKSKGFKDIAAGNFDTKDAGLILRKAWQHAAHMAEVANDVAENVTRLAIYAALREQGKTAQQAAAYAKEVTVNFNRRGSFAKVAGGFYMFFNAAMQGSARLTRLMDPRTRHGKRFIGMMGSLFATSYALALAQMMAAGDDDDGESKYDKAISDGQAQRSLNFYLGGGKSFALPVPYGPNIFTYAGYRTAKLHYDLMRGRDPSIGKAAGDIVGQATMSMSPLDPGRGWTAFVPEALRVPLQAARNRSDFGGKLNYTLMGTSEEKHLPLADKTLETTGVLYRWMAEGLNTASGGTEYRGGAVNMTGEQARYIAEQFGGGLLRLATESYELIGNTLAGIDPEPSDIPLANVYLRGKGDYRHAPAYYENREELDKTKAQWKKAVLTGDTKAMDAIIKRAPWIEGAETDAGSREGKAAQAGSVMEADREIRRAIRDLRDEQEAVRADPTLDWRERKRLLREIDRDIAERQKDFNAAMNAARGVRSVR